MAELTQVAANVVGPAEIHEIAGDTITAGMPIYKDTASVSWKRSQANAVATAKAGGVAVNSASPGQPISVQRVGEINLGATLVIGMIYCVSAANPGKIIPSTDLASTNFPVILGMAKTAALLKLAISELGVAKP